MLILGADRNFEISLNIALKQIIISLGGQYSVSLNLLEVQELTDWLDSQKQNLYPDYNGENI
jgi:hypothetical protein